MERIDSLFSYQKKLHEIINVTEKPEVQIRAISKLHPLFLVFWSTIQSPVKSEIQNK